MPQKQITVRLDEELHKWLKGHIKEVRPRTTMNNFIAWLIEMYRDAEAEENSDDFDRTDQLRGGDV